MRYCFALLLSGFLAVSPAFAAETDSTVLTQFLKSLSTLQAHFRQTLYNERGEALENSSGDFYLQRPNRFRWSYQSPYEQLIIADGAYVWIYDSDLEQVTKRDLAQALGNTPAFLISSESRIDQDFNITPLENIDGMSRLLLQPKASEAQFSSIEVRLQQAQLVRLTLHDNLGQVTIIEFQDQVLNQALAPDLFSFTPPEGTDVIEDF